MKMRSAFFAALATTLASGIATAHPGHLIEDGPVAHGLADTAIVWIVAMVVVGCVTLGVSAKRRDERSKR